MLTHLAIKSVALADKLDIEFRPGLNVITGETGAGKSIIIGAISALMGARVGSTIIRDGDDKAIMSAAFSVTESSRAGKRLIESDLWEGDPVIFSREVPRKGGSRCRINGRLVNVSQLADIGSTVVDIYGQHDHQTLQKSTEHLDLLDALGGPTITTWRRRVQELYDQRQQLLADIARIQQNERERERQQDLLQYQINEIESAGLVAGEEEELDREFQRLANAERLATAVETAYGMLYEGDGMTAGVTHLIGQVIESLQSVAAVDPEIKTMADSVEHALVLLEEVARDLRDYGDNVTFDPERLEQISNRRDQISGLKRKYGGSVGEILAFLEECEKELATLVDSDELLKQMQKEDREILSHLTEAVIQLSEERKRVAGPLSEQVTKRLALLNMPGARFEIDMSVQYADDGIPMPGGEKVQVTRRGVDTVSFLFSSHPGEQPKPLSQIASGGEMSRVMLAIKATLAQIDSPSTLIFDEVDAGLGGHTAETVADTLAKLAKTHQVLVVTHLAQIAVRADHHMVVEKSETEGRPTVTVRTVTGDERVREIGRMLDGLSTDTSIQHAKALLKRTAKLSEQA